MNITKNAHQKKEKHSLFGFVHLKTKIHFCVVMMLMMMSNYPKNIKKCEMSLSLVALGLRDLGSTAMKSSGQFNVISFIPSHK